MCAEEKQSARVPYSIVNGYELLCSPCVSYVLSAISSFLLCTVVVLLWPHERCRCLPSWRQLSLLPKLRIHSQELHFWIGPNFGLPLHQGRLVDDALRSIYLAW